MLKEKLLIVSVAMILVALTSAPLASAAPSVTIDGYTDKPYYKPGETVTLNFWIQNDGPEGIFLKNVTIEYPWYSPLWDGNQTIKYASTVGLTEGQNRSETITFTIPTDGRAYTGYIYVRVWYEYTTVTFESESFYLNVASVPSFGAFENMDKIVTLFTVLVVLTIVCTIIIAATIFLARRPQVTWKAEEKA